MRARVRTFVVESSTLFPTAEDAKAHVYDRIDKGDGAIILLKRHGNTLWYEDDGILYMITSEPEVEPFGRPKGGE